MLPKNIAPQWGGIEKNNGKDYAFACSFSDYTSVAEYNNTEIIVLGDEPLMTGVIQENKHSVFIVRQVYAETESDIISLIEQTDFNQPLYRLAHNQICLDSTDYVLFDSVDIFEDVSESAAFFVEPGAYSVDTYEIGNETTKVIIDRIMKKQRTAEMAAPTEKPYEPVAKTQIDNARSAR